MKQSMGIIMILVGALCFHIASSNENPLNIREVWKDILNTFDASNPGDSGNSGSGGDVAA